MTYDDARALVYQRVNEPDPYWPERPEISILDDETIEKSWGWVFFYQSSEFLKTGDTSVALAGNAPYIVHNRSGELVETGTAYPIEYYIEQFEKTLGIDA
jgi:hypothetical protein